MCLFCLCPVFLSFSSEPLDGALQKLFILPVFVFFTQFFWSSCQVKNIKQIKKNECLVLIQSLSSEYKGSEVVTAII